MIKKVFKKIFNITNKNNQDLSPYTKDYFLNESYLIGEYTYGRPNVYFKATNSNLVIGNYCSVASEVVILLGGNHRADWITTYPFPSIYLNMKFQSFKDIDEYNVSKGDVIIGNDVWIGYGSIILSGVKIGNGAVIAAGSVVSKNIGSYEIWGGNPARFIKKRFTDDQINELERIKWWLWPIEKLNNYANELCSNDIELFIDKVARERNNEI